MLAFNIVGNSEPSNSVSVTTLAGWDGGILSNGSFEDGVDFDSYGSWVLQPQHVSWSDDVAKSGEYSLKFRNSSGNYLEPEYNFKPLFECYGSGTYTVTMSVYVPASNNGKVELYFTPQNVYFQPAASQFDKWLSITRTVNYSAGNDIKLKAKTYNGPSGATFYVDNVAITTTIPINALLQFPKH